MCAIPINPPSPTSYPHPRPPTTPLTHPRSGFVVSNHTSPGRDLQPHHPWSRLIVSSHTPPQVRTHRLQPHQPSSGLAISNHTTPGQDSWSPTAPPQARTRCLQPHQPRSGLIVSSHATPGRDLQPRHPRSGWAGGGVWVPYPGKGKSSRHLRLQTHCSSLHRCTRFS